MVEHGVTIIGWFNLASTVPYHASQMYARNLSAFLLHLVKDGKLQLNLDDEIIRDTLLTRGRRGRERPGARVLRAAGDPGTAPGRLKDEAST